MPWSRSGSRRSNGGGHREVPGYLKRFAAENREDATPASRLLAGCLRNMDFGLRLWTEHAIQIGQRGFIFDLYFPDLKLAIEVDGGSHRGKRYQDRDRDIAALETHGIVTLRVSNSQVFYHRGQILSQIEQVILLRARSLGVALGT